MSRSYKNYPCSKDGNRRKKRDKQIANRRIRATRWKSVDIPSGGKYKQITCSNDICYWKIVCTFQEEIELHQRWYMEALRDFGPGHAALWIEDWRDLYSKWARYYLWK